MNFADFMPLKEQSKLLSACLDDCIEAERSARLRPMHTLTLARRALENLYLEQCRVYNVYFEKLQYAIDDVNDYFPRQRDRIRNHSHYIRKKGNRDIHPDEVNPKPVNPATEESIDLAMRVLQKLYEVLGMIYGTPKGKSFKEIRVPFDDYEIIRQINDPTNTSFTRYFVRGANGRDYYLQCLSHQELAELETRRQHANKMVYENSRRRGNRLLLPTSISLPYESDRRVLIYNAFPETILLSELEGAMSMKNALKLALDLIEALEELKKLGMYHRSIYPGCIMVDPENSGYEAFLMDLQTSKIVSSNVTVNPKLVAAYDKSQYVPACLWGRPLDNVDWEKVDVFAVCRVLLFCLDKSLVSANSTSRFREHAELGQSNALRALYSKLFLPDSSLRNIPNLDSLKETFRNEYNKCM